jgi:hypothetical protein
MTVEEPRAGIVRDEANGDVVVRARPEAHDVAADWVLEIVSSHARSPNDGERVSVQVKGMWCTKGSTCSRHRELYDLVAGNRDESARRHQNVRVLGT